MHKLREVFKNMFQTEDEHPFGGTPTTHAYLVQRSPRKSFVVYSSSFIDRYFHEFDMMNGIMYQLINHRDEASPACNKVREIYAAELICHEKEADAIRDKHVVVDRTLSGETVALDEGKLLYYGYSIDFAFS
jgi:hypothetical protein